MQLLELKCMAVEEHSLMFLGDRDQKSSTYLRRLCQSMINWFKLVTRGVEKRKDGCALKCDLSLDLQKVSHYDCKLNWFSLHHCFSEFNQFFMPIIFSFYDDWNNEQSRRIYTSRNHLELTWSKLMIFFVDVMQTGAEKKNRFLGTIVRARPCSMLSTATNAWGHQMSVWAGGGSLRHLFFFVQFHHFMNRFQLCKLKTKLQGV